MSADLMVFDKSRAPVEPREFLKWFYEKTAWTSDRDYTISKEHHRNSWIFSRRLSVSIL